MEGEYDFGLGGILSENQLVPKAVLEISEAVNNTENIDELYFQVHKIIDQYIPAKNFYIALYDKDNNTISYPYFVDEFESLPDTSNIGSPIQEVTSYALHRNNPLLITSKMLNDIIKMDEISPSCIDFREWLGVPLKTPDNKTIGLVAVQNKDETKEYNEEHKKFLSFVSNQIAAAIQFKNSFEQIKRNESRFRTLYQKNPLMLFIIDEHGTVIDINDQAEVDLGYTAGELIGKNVSEVFHPEDRVQVERNISECLEKAQTTFKWELRKVSKQGDVLWVRESATALTLSNETSKILISCENITESKKTELKLRESNERYRLLTENIDEMILLHDKSGNILFVNEAGLSITKYPKEKILQFNVYSLFEGEYSERIIEYISGKTKENSLYFFEVELEDYYHNIVPLEINVTRFENTTGGENLLLVARDMRERRDQEASIRKYNEELKNSNYAKDKFFSIIAHDLRSPFNALLSYSDILTTEFDELSRDEIKEYTSHMHNVTKNLYNLLNNLLDWSRMQTNRYDADPVKFDLNDTLNKVLSMFGALLKEKSINVEINLNGRTFVYADENMISTVFRNLLSNSIKFSEEESKIVITTREQIDCVEIEIEDFGIGMLKEDIAKLFRIDINHTTLGTKREKGTGLGLILAKEMIEKNGGNIKVESNLGEGSKFTFTVPKK